MSFRIENAAEAYAAVALLAAGADGLGTMEERRFLFEELGTMDAFAEHDAESLGAMLGALTGRMFTEAVRDDGRVMDPDAITRVCAGVKAVLSDDRRGEALMIAARVACSDGVDDAERKLIGQIAEGLGLGADAASDAMARASS